MEEWNEIEIYLKEYIGKYYEISETAGKFILEKIFRMSLHMGKIKQY